MSKLMDKLFSKDKGLYVVRFGNRLPCRKDRGGRPRTREEAVHAVEKALRKRPGREYWIGVCTEYGTT